MGSVVRCGWNRWAGVAAAAAAAATGEHGTIQGARPPPAKEVRGATQRVGVRMDERQ